MQVVERCQDVQAAAVGAVAASMHPEKIEASGSNVRQFISLTDQELFTFIFRIYPQKGDAVVHTNSFLTRWKYPVFGRVPNTRGPCSSSFKKHFEPFRCRAPLFDCTILALLRGRPRCLNATTSNSPLASLVRPCGVALASTPLFPRRTRVSSTSTPVSRFATCPRTHCEP
jgi:hypothetical protein